MATSESVSGKPGLAPDLAEAERHLTLLDESAERFTFQTFTDDKERKKAELAAAAARGERYRDPLARVFTCTLAQCAKALTTLNRAGAGVFVTVNETDGKGRGNANIRRIRAVWQEDDGEGKALPLAPHFAVESSPGKFHRYLLVEGLSLEGFKAAQGSMVAGFGSDPNAKDAARVLRLAGFYHLKNPQAPHRVRIVSEDGGLPYAAEAILKAFPPPTESKAAAPPPPPKAPTLDEKILRDLRSALCALRADDREVWVRLGMALKTLGEAGRGLWLEWSATSEKFDPGDAARAWESFKPSQIGHKAVFEAARQAGWLNPAKQLPKPPQGGLAAFDFEAESKARQAFKTRIDEAGEDFDQLVFVLFPEVEQAPLLASTRENLVKMIAKQARISVAALRAGAAGSAGPPSGGSRQNEEDWVERLNRLHAVVNLQGNVRIMNIGRCPIFERRLLTFSSRSDFVTLYENQETFRNGDRIDIGTAWLKHPRRKAYSGIAFMPGIKLPEDVFNLWEGFGVEGKNTGSCQLFLNFVRDVICDGCEVANYYVLGWLAHLVQRPAELPGTALVLRGAQGVGKNTFVETMARLVNEAHYVQLTHMEHLTGKFSAHRAGALLIFANEASWGGDKQSDGPLKSLVTDEDTLLEEKHRNAVKVRNFARLIVATNRPWPVARDEDDRRFVVLDVSAAHKEDAAYFDAIKQEMRSGGYACLMHYLQRSDISDWHPRNVPLLLRERGWDMKIRSGGSVIEWWFECLEEGAVARPRGGGNAEPWLDFIPTPEVRDIYGAWCMKRGYRHQATMEELGKHLHRWGIERRRPTISGKQTWCYAFPPLKEARRLFARAITMPLDYWEKDA